MYYCSITHRSQIEAQCSRFVLLPLFCQTLVSRMCFIIHKIFNLKTNIK